MPPALYLIPTALSDATPLAAVMPQENLRLAPSLRHFIVENVRSARRFLRRCDPAADISAMDFQVLDEHTPREAVAPMLEPLRRGLSMGLLSEAGCPAVADPGAWAVAAAQAEGLPVMPLVGPSSILLSLMASGFNGQCFAFQGYLPYDAARRKALFAAMQRAIDRQDQTQIFIETPYRNNRLIRELASGALPPSSLLCVASDLTGPAQSITVKALREWATASYDYDKRPTIFLLGR